MPMKSISNTEGMNRMRIIVNGGKATKACLIAIPLTDQMIIETIRAMTATYCVLFPLNDIFLRVFYSLVFPSLRLWEPRCPDR